MSSGLDQLTAQRERSTRRSMPPPRNPPRATPVALPAEQEEPVADHQVAEPPQDETAATPTLEEVQVRVPQPDAAQPTAITPQPHPPSTRPAPIQKAASRTSAKTHRAKVPPVESPGSEDELAKYSIYFDGTADEFLEATRVAGRRLKPKLSISRSSVVRLALERLSDSMSPDEVAFELGRNVATSRGTGRPRL